MSNCIYWNEEGKSCTVTGAEECEHCQLYNENKYEDDKDD